MFWALRVEFATERVRVQTVAGSYVVDEVTKQWCERGKIPVIVSSFGVAE